jgi:hypothetical protein
MNFFWIVAGEAGGQTVFLLKKGDLTMEKTSFPDNLSSRAPALPPRG